MARADVLRDRIANALKEATDEGDQRTAGTMRLLLAAINERDACARESSVGGGVSEVDILDMIRDMVSQRRAEMSRCESGARLDLVEQEAEEIEVLERFLPPALSRSEIEDAVEGAIAVCGASKLKDIGPVLAELKSRFDGNLDVAEAKRLLVERLS